VLLAPMSWDFTVNSPIVLWLVSAASAGDFSCAARKRRDCHDKTINPEAASIVASSRRRWKPFAWNETPAFGVH
jgi:hypothetical protein